MAHFPRWIESSNVPSEIMLSAFLSVPHFEKSRFFAETGCDGHLTVVEHGGPENAPPVGGVVSVPCPLGFLCKRCATKKSGYTFKWYAPLWSEAYMSMLATMGYNDVSWKPGDSERYTGAQCFQLWGAADECPKLGLASSRSDCFGYFIEPKSDEEGFDYVSSILAENKIVAISLRCLSKSKIKKDVSAQQFYIEIDCAPGSLRPSFFLPSVLQGTGLQPKEPLVKFFGSWKFDYSHTPATVWREASPKIFANLSRLHLQGLIRYGSCSAHV